jgi:pimeloyl-ACP methyl ester carboxylesterase
MYDPLITPLRARGYDIHILEPPCYPAGYHASSCTGHPSMYDDAKYINDFVMKLANDGNEVVVIAHSYGGKFKPFRIAVFRRMRC